MWLVSLVLVVLCLALTVFAALDVRRQQRALRQLQADIVRQLAYRSERARFLAFREQLAGTSDLASGLVTTPVTVTRRSHESIAAIPFTVFDNIPATAQGSKLIREIHDDISGVVYDTIEAATKGIAGVIRRGVTGSAARPTLSGSPGSPAADPDALRKAAEAAVDEATPDGEAAPDDSATTPDDAATTPDDAATTPKDSAGPRPNDSAKPRRGDAS